MLTKKVQEDLKYKLCHGVQTPCCPPPPPPKVCTHARARARVHTHIPVAVNSVIFQMTYIFF